MTEVGRDGCFEERNEEGVEGVDFVYNPNKSMSIDVQRRRLPIYQSRDEILYLLEKYQTVVIQGETGSGKSTQIPQYLAECGWTRGGGEEIPQCLSESGWNKGREEEYLSQCGWRKEREEKMIGITEPRRVAAVRLAHRVAEEQRCHVGSGVGYSIRFDDNWTPGKTGILYMTEGILLNQLKSDPLLSKYSLIMIDEVHERSTNTDIILGLLKKILKRRPLLRLIVTSATLDVERMQKYFDLRSEYKTDSESKSKRIKSDLKPTSTICMISGEKSFPVDVQYLKEPTADYVKSTIDVCIKIHESDASGDILAFLTGTEEVDHVVSVLMEYSRTQREKQRRRMFILPFTASLSTRDQLKVFSQFPSSTRKVVIATNVAETSLTIPGIVHVIDCGFVKMRMYDARRMCDSLAIVPISQSSGEQRRGRCGRSGPGSVYRLYQKREYERLSPFTIPEIQRSNLSSSILQLISLGIQNVVKFDFLSKPPPHNLITGLEELFALDAIDSNGQLTDSGLKMAEFPFHPMFAKMILASEKLNCSSEAITMTAMLQVENIFQSSSSGQSNIRIRNQRHAFAVQEGDLISYLNIYNQFIASGRIRSWSDSRCLNYKAMNRVHEIRSRLESLLRRFKIKVTSSNGDIETVLKCITSGFFPNTAYLSPDGTCYKTIRGDHKLFLHPTSVLNWAKKPPKYVIFHSILHTSQQFMRDVTAIKKEWLYELAPHYYQFGTQRELLVRNTE